MNATDMDATTLKENLKEKSNLAMIKKIGTTTFQVYVHFNEESKETMQDKIKRMMAADVEAGGE